MTDVRNKYLPGFEPRWIVANTRITRSYSGTFSLLITLRREMSSAWTEEYYEELTEEELLDVLGSLMLDRW